jgi:hypothetical protein
MKTARVTNGVLSTARVTQARMGEGRNVYRVFVGKPKKKDHLKDQDIDGRMGSKWILGGLVGVGVCGVD